MQEQRLSPFIWCTERPKGFYATWCSNVCNYTATVTVRMREYIIEKLKWQPSKEALAEEERRKADPLACIDWIVVAVNSGEMPVKAPGEVNTCLKKKDAWGLAIAWSEALLMYGPRRCSSTPDLTSRLAEFGIVIEVKSQPRQVTDQLIENETEFEVNRKRNALSSQLRSFRECILNINAGLSSWRPKEDRLFQLTESCVEAAQYYVACRKPITMDVVRKIMKKQGASIREYRYAAWIRQRITGEPKGGNCPIYMGQFPTK